MPDSSMSRTERSPEPTDLRFGRENKTTGGSCCGKPVGCTMTHESCLYLRHPWKRQMVFGEMTGRCMASSVQIDPATQEHVEMKCSRDAHSDSRHEMEPTGRSWAG